MLGGLGPEFDFVIVNLTSIDLVTLQEVQYMLQTHEMRLEISLLLSTIVDISGSVLLLTLLKNSLTQGIVASHMILVVVMIDEEEDDISLVAAIINSLAILLTLCVRSVAELVILP